MRAHLESSYIFRATFFKWRECQNISVADLEGVRVVRLNPPLRPDLFSFMGKFIKKKKKKKKKKSGKMLKTKPLLIDLNPLPEILDPPLHFVDICCRSKFDVISMQHMRYPTEADRGHFTVKLLCFFTLLQNFHFCKIFTSTFYCTSDFFCTSRFYRTSMFFHTSVKFSLLRFIVLLTFLHFYVLSYFYIFIHFCEKFTSGNLRREIMAGKD